MRITCFGSGSDGNALLIEQGETRVLIDAGIPVTRLRKELLTRGISESELTALLITHEHSDHIRALDRFSRNYHGAVLTRPDTARSLRGVNPAAIETIELETSLLIGSLSITPVPVPHDAVDPVGFVVTADAVKVAIFTDLGEVTSDVANACAGASLIVLESNYDPTMLDLGRYPTHLKRRIRGRFGHLSNDECANLLERAVTDETSEVWLAHLSLNNNNPAVAHRTTAERLSAEFARDRVRTLPRHGRTLTWDSTADKIRTRQLGFALD